MKPKILRVGEDSVLLECPSLDDVTKLVEILRHAKERQPLSIIEMVSAARTILVRGEIAQDRSLLVQTLENLATARTPIEDPPSHHRDIRIPVSYRGEDLAEVARAVNLSVEQVIERHLAADYRAAFTGFAPGFAYLVGLDPALIVPRRPNPRARVPAGSVAIADEFTAVYPNESPGGWNLIGHTGTKLWDLSISRPSLISPGDKVKFVAERERLNMRLTAATSNRATLQRSGVAALTVTNPGFETLIQDLGRPGYGAIGISPAGALDQGALKLANFLVGNDRNAAALEIGPGSFSAKALAPLAVVLTGATRALEVVGHHDTRKPKLEEVFRVDPGDLIQIASPKKGMRSILAIRGGVETSPVLGSASRDTLSKIGPEPLSAGDTIYVDTSIGASVADHHISAKFIPERGVVCELEVILGPRDGWFAEEAIRDFFEQSWEVTTQTSRVGVRLSGHPVARKFSYESRELPSEGLVTGAIQIPPNGLPLIFLADRPVTGGYPVIGVVRQQHLDLAAQLPPGALVRFRKAEPDNKHCRASRGTQFQ